MQYCFRLALVEMFCPFNVSLICFTEVHLSHQLVLDSSTFQSLFSASLIPFLRKWFERFLSRVNAFLASSLFVSCAKVNAFLTSSFFVSSVGVNAFLTSSFFVSSARVNTFLTSSFFVSCAKVNAFVTSSFFVSSVGVNAFLTSSLFLLLE